MLFLLLLGTKARVSFRNWASYASRYALNSPKTCVRACRRHSRVLNSSKIFPKSEVMECFCHKKRSRESNQANHLFPEKIEVTSAPGLMHRSYNNPRNISTFGVWGVDFSKKRYQTLSDLFSAYLFLDCSDAWNLI